MFVRILAFALMLTTPTFLVIVFCSYFKIVPKSTLENKAAQVQPSSKLSPSTAFIVDTVNQKNAATKSLVCDDISVRLWENGHRYRLSAELLYQKPHGFRFLIRSFFGDELDLGSNEKEFWYWSRRDRSPGLYWAVYEDFGKTRLKTPFDPLLMRASFGLENLDLTTAEVTESSSDLMLTYRRENSSGKEIRYSVLLDKAKQVISGFILTDTSGNLLATCEIEEHEGNLPRRILYTWHEEKRVMSVILNRPVANQAVPAGSFTMPSYTPRINMAEE